MAFLGLPPRSRQRRLFRYRCIYVFPTAQRDGGLGLMVASIASPNGAPVEFRYLIWSRSRSLSGPPVLIRFTYTYRGSFSTDSVTRTGKRGFATCTARRGPEMT